MNLLKFSGLRVASLFKSSMIFSSMLCFLVGLPVELPTARLVELALLVEVECVEVERVVDLRVDDA